jgi:glycosyltransferase involved in cell wall biosynthesis
VLDSTSRGESFGLTIAEAMARRCAVAAPDQSPFPELVEPGKTGSLFIPGSADSAADRLKELLGDPALRAAYGRNGRESILARFARAGARRARPGAAKSRGTEWQAVVGISGV